MIRRCPGCDQSRPGLRADHLMCTWCWWHVPAGLRRAVNRTWRACKNVYIDSPKWKPYYAARAAAIDAVKRLEGSGGGR